MFEIDTKRKVTKREYNRWVKWLRTQGYSGPFARLNPSHECVKRLAKELRKEPPTILETRPRDPRTIASNLARYERKHRQQKPEDLEIVDTKKETSLQWQQIEHIRSLQELARSTVDALPELPDLDDVNEFDVFYFSLAKLFLRLTGDVRWPDLAAHLGEKAQEVKDMSFKLDPYIFPHWRCGLPVPDDYKKSVHNGWVLIINSGLQVVADSGDTREWEYYGLNQRCPSCPIQRFESVDIGPWDF